MLNHGGRPYRLAGHCRPCHSARISDSEFVDFVKCEVNKLHDALIGNDLEMFR
jgi:hypothetical protein